MASALYTDVKRKLEGSVFTRPQEGLFGLKEWEDEGFVPEPVPTAGLILTAAVVGPNSKRLRGASTRVVKKPERFASGEYEDAGNRSARSTPSPLLRPEHHSRMAGSPPAEELSIIRPPRSSDLEVTSPEAPRPPEDAASNCLREQSADQTALASGQPQAAGQHEQGMSELLRQESQQKTPNLGLEALPAAVVDGPEVVQAPRKRPYLQLEMPTSENLSGDLHFLWTPCAAGPLSTSLEMPFFLDPQSSPSSRPLSPYNQHPPLFQPTPAAGATHSNAHSEAGPHAFEASAAAAGLTDLDTPTLMMLPLPEGDLSWSPLRPPPQLRADAPTWLQPALAQLLCARPALRAHASDRPVQAVLPHDRLLDTGNPSPAALPAAQGPGIQPSSRQHLGFETDSRQPGIPGHTSDTLGRWQRPQMRPAATAMEGAAAAVAGRVAAMEAEVLRQEALLGENDALVGQRWLELSRACQAEDPHTYAEKAEHALVKAWKICSICFRNCNYSNQCDVPFQFLLERMRTVNQGLNVADAEPSIATRQQ